MWKLVEGPTVVRATPQLAQRFANMAGCPGDRPLNSDRCNQLRRIIANQEFRTAEWASAVCEGKEYRVNGKHTSTILTEIDGSFPDVMVIVEKYACDSLEALGRLYSTFDSRLSMRSAGDNYRAIVSANPEFAHWPSSTLTLVIGGLAYERWEAESTKHAPVERAALLLRQPDFGIWAKQLLDPPDMPRHMVRIAVLAAMAKTYFRSTPHATKFWQLVRTGESPDPRSADRVLQKYLLSARVGTGHGRGRGSSPIQFGSTHEIYVKCLHAWNAWRREEGTSLRYYQSADTPAVV